MLQRYKVIVLCSFKYTFEEAGGHKFAVPAIGDG